MSETFLAPTIKPEDDEIERSLRPRNLDEFVGQKRTMGVLRDETGMNVFKVLM